MQKDEAAEFGLDVGIIGDRDQDVEPGCGHGQPRFSSDGPHSAIGSTGDDNSTELASSLALRPASGMRSRFIFGRSTPNHFTLFCSSVAYAFQPLGFPPKRSCCTVEARARRFNCSSSSSFGHRKNALAARSAKLSRGNCRRKRFQKNEFLKRILAVR